MPFVSSGGSLVQLERSSLYNRPSAITSYTGLTSTYEAIYRSQPNVRFVVDFVARNIADLPIRLMRRVSERERRHERDHPFDRFLRNPNPRVTRYELIRDIVTDWLIFDQAFGLKVGIAGAGNALVRHPPRMIEPTGRGPYPDGFRLLSWAGQPVWDYDRVLHLHGYNPDGDPTGVSPIETLRRILAEDLAAGEYREQFWNNSARTSAVIERPVAAPKWSDEARERFEASFSATWAGRGPGAGGTPVLEEGMTLNPKATQTAQEAEYLGARKLTRAEVASAYFIDPSMLGIIESAATGRLDTNHRMLYQDGLGPALTFLASAFWLQVLPDFVSSADERDELEVEFQLEHKLRGSFIEESEAMTRATGGPWMTRNEGRAVRGLRPLDEESGADDLIVPLNVTAGGRPNPIDTNLPTDPLPGQLARRRARGRKALEVPALNGAGWIDQHVTALGRFLDRQASSVASRLGAGDGIEDAFDRDRWDAELAEDLGGLALALAPQAAEQLAARFDVTYDLDVAEAWLLTNARIAAETFNENTLALVTDALATGGTGTRARKDATVEPEEDEELSPLELVAGVFLVAREQRAAPFALDRVAGVTNFARQDVASQAGASTKTWITPAANARASHAALSGVTIASNERFSNGGLWPHDPALGPDESAGCTCYVDFTEADLTEELLP